MVEPVEKEETAPFEATLADVQRMLKRQPQMSCADFFKDCLLPLLQDMREETEDGLNSLAEEAGLGSDEDELDTSADDLSFIDKTSAAFSDLIVLVEATFIAAGFRGAEGTLTPLCPPELSKMYEDLSKRIVVLMQETSDIRKALAENAVEPPAVASQSEA